MEVTLLKKKKKSSRPKKSFSLDPDTRERQKLINQMTGWQRNQWVRAGRPVDTMVEFTTLTKENRNAA